MRKFGVLATTIFISIVLAGIFGILHDQITYSIAPEYFTKFKYQQFGFDPALFGGHRQTVAVIGFLATWWVGLLIGFFIGFTALLYPDHKSMSKASVKAISIVFIIAVLIGFIGFLRGRYYLSKTGVNWWLPEDLVHRDDFITVGSIHNYSYLGGGIGLLLAIIYLFVRKKSAVAADQKQG